MARSDNYPDSTRTISNPAIEQDIRRRAYELYVERGRADGYELDDWLRAKEEITKGRARTAVV